MVDLKKILAALEEQKKIFTVKYFIPDEFYTPKKQDNKLTSEFSDFNTG